MTSRLLALMFAVAAVFGNATPGWTQSNVRSWLDDAKPQAWNKPAAAIPAAPRMQPSVDPRCRAAARPAQLPEDTRLRERGWDLVGAFQGGWQLLVPGQPPAPSPSTGLAGTSWQLVKFEGSDDTTLTPDDRSKYTIEFAAGGRLSARIDCNRGSGTWTSAGPSQVEFGPMALTRAQCLNPSLHDHIVRQWGSIRSYVLKDGHLFLALKADGGIFEFESITPRK